MAGGLIALFDDVATLAKLAASSIDDIGAAAGRAGAKAAGVVIDDAAVTPQYVAGLAAERELPIIKRIARGSIKNKLLFIVPAALLLSQFVPFLLTPILMLGGGYLCYEAVHKIWGSLSGHEHGHGKKEAVSEEELVAGAIRTDLILSAEIMVIALDEITNEPFLSRAVILVIVAIAITVLIYGAVAIIVKMDDVGLRMAQEDSETTARLGGRIVAAMPKVLSIIGIVGTAAMLWVGGHIELVAFHELSQADGGLGIAALDGPYSLVHGWEEAVGGGFIGWLVNTAASAFIGLIVGGILVAGIGAVTSRKDPEGEEAAAH